VKPDAWSSSLEPALNRRNRKGWGLFIGRPKGRGHFYDLWRDAKTRENWASFHWTSEQALGAEHMREQREGVDERTFRQEYLAEWVTFEGLAYYTWDPNLHYRALSYDPNLPLVLCFDFNVSPGVCAILQEQQHVHAVSGDAPVGTTCAIDEVHVPDDSNTRRVCEKLLLKIRNHKGDVFVYGDPSGGARTANSESSNWDVVRQHLKPVFGERMRWRVAKAQPHVIDRLNAVNTRLRKVGGQVQFLVDPRKCPRTVEDFEGVTLLDGGGGEIAKRKSEALGLTHLTDAIGYYIHERFPLVSKAMVAA
jgi:hypothetical protein